MTCRRASTADAPAIAEVHVTSWRTTYRGLLLDDLLAGLSVEARAEQGRRQPEGGANEDSVIYVAEDVPSPGADASSRVVGFASAGPQREEDSELDAGLYAIYFLAIMKVKSLAARQGARSYHLGPGVASQVRACGDAPQPGEPREEGDVQGPSSRLERRQDRTTAAS